MASCSLVLARSGSCCVLYLTTGVQEKVLSTFPVTSLCFHSIFAAALWRGEKLWVGAPVGACVRVMDLPVKPELHNPAFLSF